MHELTICLNIIRIVERATEKKSINEKFSIKKVWIEVGDLAGVEVDLLKYSFPIAAKNTILKNSCLEVVQRHAMAKCNKCQKKFFIQALYDPCPLCRTFEYSILKGKELNVMKVEIG